MPELNENKFNSLFGNSLEQKYSRFMTFVDHTPPSYMFKKTTLPALLGMTLGGTVGGIVGCVGGPKGAMVGAGSGAGVGILAGGTYSGYQTRKEYRAWIKQHRSDEILEEFREVIHSQPKSNQFVCPLTKELIHLPFTDPWGHNFEREAIEKWVKHYGTSPTTKKAMTLADLRPNFLLMGQQARFYRELLQEETSRILLTQMQKLGIEALLKDLEVQIRNCFDAENRLLHSQMVQKKISPATYASQLGIMAELLYL